MTDRFSLNGRVALVTGASRGLGLAMAEALAEHGARVVLNGRDPETLRSAAAKINQRRIRGVRCLRCRGRPGCYRRYRQPAWQARYPHQQCRNSASPPSHGMGRWRFRADPCHQSHLLLPTCPRGGTRHGASRSWPHHQYRLDRRDPRSPDHSRLRRSRRRGFMG